MRPILNSIPQAIVSGGEDGSPLFHIRLRERLPTRHEEEKLLQDIVDEVNTLYFFFFNFIFIFLVIFFFFGFLHIINH